MSSAPHFPFISNAGMCPRPEIAVLSEGAENEFSGTWPNRVLEAVSRLELHSFRVPDAVGCALVYAGGGYLSLMYDKEGVETALWLNSLGLDAHVVVHRLPGAQVPERQARGLEALTSKAVFPKDIALQDALACRAYLERKETLPLFHVGLSSGGHLAGVMACQDEGKQKACGAIITYAPLNANHRQHKVPAGKPDYAPVEKQDFYDDWPVGLEGFPERQPRLPLFLAYALNDTSVPVEHALRVVSSMARQGKDVDLHVFGQAPHGFAFREKDGTQALWPVLAADWIKRHLAADTCRKSGSEGAGASASNCRSETVVE